MNETVCQVWAALPMDELSELDDTPVVPDGVIAPINTVFGIGTFTAIVVAGISLLAVFGTLILSAMGRGGNGAEQLVKNLIKVFGGAIGATSVLGILTLVTGGF
ncbi:Hypothetical protein AAM4_1570 [Actinomyces succiniciruminis]|uniref:Uncharacterized protein n=2 Tax=Actinomyces succiniciruminis TaxID=1522002 RepID=A0A1L7RP16_9ACTO|nr:Hypothetical protein AAM4_1570 [Actinomyces succiniciruminis]